MKRVLSAESSVLEALRSAVPGAPARTLRQMLEHGRVRLNGQVCRIASRRTCPGDVLEIGRRAFPPPRGGLEVVYEDQDVLVVVKPAGLLTVSTPHEKQRTAHAYLREYLKHRSPGSKVFVVHRLDKFVSGLLVFAKSERIQWQLRRLFEAHAIDRKYLAIVEGDVERNAGTIQSHLKEDHRLRMRSTPSSLDGKRAVTHYRVLRRSAGLTCLEVSLETGRKNQIRVHFSELGHPIAGDRAYGSRSDPLGRVGLHAFRLGFEHPGLHRKMLFEAEPPPEFQPFLPAKRNRGQGNPVFPETAPDVANRIEPNRPA
ncbi:MAG: RluA family pseudouridine synthase [Acidobacteria bacterium]|nr:RluA family pseudouridine synthase [Acidobacteriota bacterium]